MHISDEIWLSTIKKKCVYRDEKSLEQSTGLIKRKYKLAGHVNFDLDVYPFFISTREKSACHRPLTLKVHPSDWENIAENRFKEISYFDIRKIEVLSKEEILGKIKDINNKFCYVARISSSKFTELQSLLNRIPYSRVRIAPELKRIIVQSLSDEVEKVLTKWGLN